MCNIAGRKNYVHLEVHSTSPFTTFKVSPRNIKNENSKTATQRSNNKKHSNAQLNLKKLSWRIRYNHGIFIHIDFLFQETTSIHQMTTIFITSRFKR